MMRTKSLQRIRVKDLCQKCDAERQSFYYHFKDKYDLAAWIFMRDYKSALTDENSLYAEERVARFLRSMKDKGAFYKRAFEDRSQNAIQEYVVEYFTKLGKTGLFRNWGRRH